MSLFVIYKYFSINVVLSNDERLKCSVYEKNRDRLITLLLLNNDYVAPIAFSGLTNDDHHRPGPLFTKKTPSYGYRNPHYKPNTVWRPSQVYNGNPYTDKTVSS